MVATRAQSAVRHTWMGDPSPTCEVATTAPVGCMASARTSSVCRSKKRCMRVFGSITTPSAAAGKTRQPRASYARFARTSCALYPCTNSSFSVSSGSFSASAGGSNGYMSGFLMCSAHGSFAALPPTSGYMLRRPRVASTSGFAWSLGGRWSANARTSPARSES